MHEKQRCSWQQVFDTQELLFLQSSRLENQPGVEALLCQSRVSKSSSAKLKRQTPLILPAIILSWK